MVVAPSELTGPAQVAVHESGFGPFRQFAAVGDMSAIGV